MKPLEAAEAVTHNNAQTVANCAKRSRASTANSEVTGQGVALLGNNSAVPPALPADCIASPKTS
jgi:hypothetical protein